jgi:hypothetical protein
MGGDVDGLAAGSAADLGVSDLMGNISGWGAFLRGIRLVNRAPLIVCAVYLLTLLATLPFAALMRGALRTHFGNSMAAESAARGVNVQWWTEFTAQAGQVGETFETTIIGFAAVLDNLSAFADGEARPAPLVWLGLLYLFLWLFLAGGVLDRYARARPTHSHQFFSACGVYFVRFLRLLPFMFAAYYILFAVVHPLLFGVLYEALTRDLVVERTAFLIRLAMYVTFGFLLVVVNVVVDYAKVRAVVEDRRSMAGALAASLRFVARNPAGIAALFGLSASMFVVVLGLYAALAPGASTGAGIWVGFAIGQLYIAGRLWIRLLFLASETAFFQGRLAHAGYIAAAPSTRRDPPLVEQFAAHGPYGDRGER